MGIIMKKTVILFLLLTMTLALFACATAPTPVETQPKQTVQTQTEQTEQTEPQTTAKHAFYSEPEDDYVRYTGGGISILLESGFTAQTAQEGYIVYSNGFLTVVISATDDYDAQMLAASGFDIAELTEEDYGSILIDANELNKDCMFYDYFDNVCMQYGGKDSSGNDYEAYSVIKKDTATNTFWLIQFMGTPAVYEPYSVYFPEWAAGITFG